MRFLLDTCVISEFVKLEPVDSVMEFIADRDEKSLFVSAMTIGELHRGIQRLPVGKKKDKLLTWLSDVERRFENRVLPFDYDCAIEWAKIYSSAEKDGKTIAAFDSIIAAIASRNNMALVTRNVADFRSTGLELINPW